MSCFCDAEWYCSERSRISANEGAHILIDVGKDCKLMHLLSALRLTAFLWRLCL